MAASARLCFHDIQPTYCPHTGLFRVHVNFDTPLISVVDGPIFKPFGVVIVITVRFDLVYDNA